MAFIEQKTIDHVQPSVLCDCRASKMHIKNVLAPSISDCDCKFCACFALFICHFCFFVGVFDSSCDSVLFSACMQPAAYLPSVFLGCFLSSHFHYDFIFIYFVFLLWIFVCLNPFLPLPSFFYAPLILCSDQIELSSSLVKISARTWNPLPWASSRFYSMIVRCDFFTRHSMRWLRLLAQLP